METCVLIPQEFALAVTGVGARNSREQTATVWSNTAIPQGTVCYPFQGTVRIDNLDLYSYVDEDDVSRSLRATNQVGVVAVHTSVGSVGDSTKKNKESQPGVKRSEGKPTLP